MSRDFLMESRAQTIPNGGIIRFLAPFNQERLLICGQQALNEVLSMKHHVFPKPNVMRYILSRVLGHGIVVAEGFEHKAQRKHIAAAFSPRSMKTMYPMIWETATQSVRSIRSAIQTYKIDTNDHDVQSYAPINTKDWATRITLDSVGMAGYNTQFRTVQGENERLYEASCCLFSSTDASLLYATLLLPSWLVDWLPLRRNRELHQANEVVRTFLKNVIAEKLNDGTKDGGKCHSLLSSMIESSAFTPAELLEQSMTMLGAGYETTSSAISWAIYYLAVHPEVQSQLRREVDDSLPRPEPGTEVSENTIDRLPYLGAVCNEVLRLSPPIPAVARTAASDTTVMGTVIPKDMPIIIAPSTVNCDRTIWGNDSTEFNPDRWLRSSKDVEDENPESARKIRLLTFLHGPRNCVGQALAHSELKYVLAAWVGNFEFVVDHTDKGGGDVARGHSITSFPRTKIRIRVRAC